MKATIFSLILTFGGFSMLAAQDAMLIHYWDFEEELPEVPDNQGSSVGTAGEEVVVTEGHDGQQAVFFPSALQGNLAFDEKGYVDIEPIVSDVPQAFSMTYWVKLNIDETTNPRGIFDFSGNGNQGVQSLFIQSGANADRMAFRVDGANGLSNAAVAFAEVPEDESWFFVAATFNPVGDLGVHINGYGIDASASGLSVGDSTWDFDQYLGAFNVQPGSVTTINRGLNGSLDDVAIYSGILTQEEIDGLFSETLKPSEIGLTGLLPGELEISSVQFDRAIGQTTLVFKSAVGKSYRVLGGVDLANTSSWSEVSITEIIGTGDWMTFTHSPENPDQRYFYLIRRD